MSVPVRPRTGGPTRSRTRGRESRADGRGSARGWLARGTCRRARRAFHETGPDVVLVIGESGAIPVHAYDARRLRDAHGSFVIREIFAIGTT